MTPGQHHFYDFGDPSRLKAETNPSYKIWRKIFKLRDELKREYLTYHKITNPFPNDLEE